MKRPALHIDRPPRRPLKIFAFDPMFGREPGSRISIDIPNEPEPLQPGPQGQRLEVIDYDTAHDRFYAPVNLEDPAILMQGGLDQDESNPRFHQQMVYAVTMKVLENFEASLGRSLSLRRGKRRLRLFPHAFHGANAFYDRGTHALLFGYFRADRKDPGPLLPGQTVFTCLSHDIIAHEMTHALVDRLRRYFLEPSNEDVLAFHEGFADIVALFQHFTFQEVLRDQIQQSRTDLRTDRLLVSLAQQFGYASGTGKALRSALGEKNKRLYETVTESHQRGAILVAAVFDAFFAVYQKRICDLIRISTGGTGKLPDADLHPDLVNRIAGEAAATADLVLRMCVRAFDYLPPVDVMFGDYLRALVTADYELNPVDQFGLRASMIEAFRARGIYPENVVCLDETALLWPENPHGLPPLSVALLSGSLSWGIKAFGRSTAARVDVQSRPSEEEDPKSAFAEGLHEYAVRNAAKLALDPKRPVAAHGFYPIFRVGRNGLPLIEWVVQFTQEDRDRAEELGGLPFRGGTTVVFTTDGSVRYMISKPLATKAGGGDAKQQAQARLDRQLRFARRCALADPRFTLHEDGYEAQHMKLRMNLAALHAGITR
jgi:hypothetical protein